MKEPSQHEQFTITLANGNMQCRLVLPLPASKDETLKYEYWVSNLRINGWHEIVSHGKGAA